MLLHILEAIRWQERQWAPLSEYLLGTVASAGTVNTYAHLQTFIYATLTRNDLAA